MPVAKRRGRKREGEGGRGREKKEEEETEGEFEVKSKDTRCLQRSVDMAISNSNPSLQECKLYVDKNQSWHALCYPCHTHHYKHLNVHPV